MALIFRLDKETITKEFTHKGLYAGIVPVYMHIEDGVDYMSKGNTSVLFLTERNGVPSGTVD